MKKKCGNCGADFEDFQDNICPWCDSELKKVGSPGRDRSLDPEKQDESIRTTADSRPTSNPPYQERPPQSNYPKRGEKKKISGVSKLLTVALISMLVLFFLSINTFDFGPDLNPFVDEKDDKVRDTGSFNKTFYWTYDGGSYSLDIEIPQQKVRTYENMSHYSYDYKSNPEVFRDWITKEDDTMVLLTQKLIFKAHQENFTDLEIKEFMLRFVQKTIEYKADEGDWKYPVETIFDSVGDCEDVAFLYGTITEIAGYDSILVTYKVNEDEGHLVPAIYSPSKTGGDTTELDGREYHFAETTNDFYTIGIGPDRTEYDYDTFIKIDI